MEKKKLTKKQRNAIILSVVAVVAVAAICFVAFKPEPKLSVETVGISKQTISETLDTTGKVSSAGQDVFMIPSGVKLLTLNVKEGDIVEAGDVIATFDISSLNDALAEKKSAYDKSKTAYENAVQLAKDSKSKVAQVKQQIADLEKEIASLENKVNSDKNNVSSKPNVSEPKVEVSDALVKRFMSVAKLFGVDYEKDAAKNILVNILSAGSNANDISSMIENLSSFAGAGSFDISALASMTGSSELMNAEMSLIQLKAQLATLELQSDSTYLSAFKTIAEKSEEAYLSAQVQVASMKNGWIAKNRGMVSEVNMPTDSDKQSSSALSADFDVSSILSALTSGTEVTDIVSSLMGSSKAAVKILYYPLVADISLSKYDVLEVSQNQEAIIESPSGKEFAGKVSYVSPVASSSGGININSLMGGNTSATSVIPAQVTIEGADSSVIVGVDVSVSIITETIEDALVVPVEAICIDGEDVFVYVLEDGEAKKTSVELGISSDTHYQILSGLDFDDILIKNTVGLEDGIAVQTK